MGLPTEGNSSQVGFTLFRTSGKFGKYLVGLATGVKDRNIGPSMLVAAGGIVLKVPVNISICSQQYVNEPFGSVADAVRKNGVEAGIE
jgi:hypothetical protein